MSRDVSADASFIGGKDAVLGDTMKGTLFIYHTKNSVEKTLTTFVSNAALP
jgi:hypothetical protein